MAGHRCAALRCATDSPTCWTDLTPTTTPSPDHEAPAEAPAPGAPPPPRMVVRRLGLSAPLRWLALGARDLRRHIGIGVFYGLCFWMMALTLGAVFRHKPEYTMTIVSGCLLVVCRPGVDAALLRMSADIAISAWKADARCQKRLTKRKAQRSQLLAQSQLDAPAWTSWRLLETRA